MRAVDVASAPEALRKLNEAREIFDVILTDYMMPPGENGLELAREARRIGFKGGIVLLSGVLSEDDGDRSTGVDRVLHKPIAGEDPVEALVDVLLHYRG